MEERVKELEKEIEGLKKLIDEKDKEVNTEKERNQKLTNENLKLRKELENSKVVQKENKLKEIKWFG